MKRRVMTVIRTALLILAVLNQILGTLGAVDLKNGTANTAYAVISLVATVGAAAWAWWKNNSVTPEAQAADEYLDLLKSAEKCGAEDGEAQEEG